MKSLPIASLALVLALSGCSSSLSIDEQTKLVEYEKCLDFLANKTSWLFDSMKVRATFDNYLVQEDWVKAYNLLKEYEFDSDLKSCEKHRP